jgi:hypothetical protein
MELLVEGCVLGLLLLLKGIGMGLLLKQSILAFFQ